ncbi:TetR/AcrR family transcriptional regulator [Nonomuraea thailandensis]
MARDERPKGGIRADARRNRAAIVRVTIETLRRNPEASIPEIAAAAGVGRMTLYGHFPTRAELLEAALADALERGERTLGRLDLVGDPRDVLVQLIDTSWVLVDESRALLAAAQKQLPPARIRELHEQAEARVRELLTWGQGEEPSAPTCRWTGWYPSRTWSYTAPRTRWPRDA